MEVDYGKVQIYVLYEFIVIAPLQLIVQVLSFNQNFQLNIKTAVLVGDEID